MELPKKLKSGHLTRLAVRMKKGDRKAAAALYDDLAPKLYGFLFARTREREAAEDLSQDIFMKLIEKIGSFDAAKGAFTVWFWQMARNTLIDHYRAKKPLPFSSFDEDAVGALATEDAPDLDDRLASGKIRKFMETLGADERELFECRFAADMPYGEIARVLGKSEGALRVAASRLKAKIRKEFRESF